MNVSIIVAATDTGVVGDTTISPLWKLPADLQRFREITMGHTVIMGRKTHQAIGQPLSGRENIVVSRDKNYMAKGCIVAPSLTEAFSLASAPPTDEVFIIGGGELYKQALPYAATIYLTRVHADIPGNITFGFEENQWEKTYSEHFDANEENEYSYSYLTFKKLQSITQ